MTYRKFIKKMEDLGFVCRENCDRVRVFEKHKIMVVSVDKKTTFELSTESTGFGLLSEKERALVLNISVNLASTPLDNRL